MPRDRSLKSTISSRDRPQPPQGPIARSAFYDGDDSSLSALEEAPQGSQSNSSSHDWIGAQAHSSLTSHIEATDTLPVDWNLWKRKKLSEGDVADLQGRLELSHNVRQIEPRRPSELDPSTFIDADLQRASSPTGLIKNPLLSPLLRIPLRWTQAASRPLSAISNSWRKQKRIADQMSSFTQCLSNLASGLITAMLHFLRDCIITFGQSWKMCWLILRWPLVVLVAFLVALNTLALAYSVTHEAFLSNFCVKELPLVRDWMCTVWDQRLQSEKRGEGTETFTDPLEAFLLRNSSFSSYVLPRILGRYEIIVRSFKVDLPVSHFNTSEQDYLREQFAEFIDQSGVTIRSSQEFHSHIMGTISHSVSQTQYYIDQVSKYNLTSSPPNSEKTYEITYETDDSLSKSMAWFHSHYLVILPAGLEPFRQRVVRVPYAQSIWGLQKHLTFIADQLTVVTDMALTLRARLQDQREIGERIQKRVTLSRSINDAQRSSWRFLIDHLLWKSLASYQVEQRAQWLKVMARVFDQYSLFLESAIIEMESAIIDMKTARTRCKSLSTRLLDEVGQVRSGWATTDRATYEIRILKEGVGNLLKAFQLAREGFRGAVFY